MIAATAGLTTVAVAQNVIVLAIGIFLASASAGFSWTPFNLAVRRLLYEGDRPRALSVISSGTAVGVIIAGALALSLAIFGFSWRVVWAVFAASAAVVAIGNLVALKDTAEPAGEAPPRRWCALATRSAIPLYLVALLFGATNGVYVTFAADRVADQGGLTGLPLQANGAVVFIAYGALGLVGLLTARIKRAIGLTWLLRILAYGAALSFALIAWFPSSWGAVIFSAGSQGAFVMMISAVLSFWSEELFPDLPSLSFTAALLITGVGNIVGPVLAGVASSAFGSKPMFVGAAAVALATAFLLKPDSIREKASTIGSS